MIGVIAVPVQGVRPSASGCCIIDASHAVPPPAAAAAAAAGSSLGALLPADPRGRSE
eukprot:SAG25_NODE_237_length_11266_cov_6.061789_1_plen_57_part_00